MGDHLIDGQFQSDKYPGTPRGFVPLKCTDKAAQDLLWEYAKRHAAIDPAFAADLRTALMLAGFDPSAPTLGDDARAALQERLKELERADTAISAARKPYDDAAAAIDAVRQGILEEHGVEVADECEGCGKLLFTGELGHVCSDGPTLCEACAPTWSDLLAQYIAAKGETTSDQRPDARRTGPRPGDRPSQCRRRQRRQEARVDALAMADTPNTATAGEAVEFNEAMVHYPDLSAAPAMVAIVRERFAEGVRLGVFQAAPEDCDLNIDVEALAIVEQQHGIVEAFATFYEIGDESDDGHGDGIWVHLLWVEPDRRRRGHAAALLEQIGQIAAERGLVELQLGRMEGNDAMRGLLNRLGWAVHHIVHAKKAV